MVPQDFLFSLVSVGFVLAGKGLGAGSIPVPRTSDSMLLRDLDMT